MCLPEGAVEVQAGGTQSSSGKGKPKQLSKWLIINNG